MEYRPNRLPNPHIQSAAREYYRACEVLEAYLQLSYRLEREPGFYLPLLNAAAVAVELYLKSLAAEDEYYPLDSPVPGIKRVQARAVKPGHAPADLLDEIPDPIQSQLTAAFKASPLSQQADS